MFCFARSAAICALVRFSSSTDRPALFAGRARLDVLDRLRQSALALPSSAACRILNSLRGNQVLLHRRIELGAPRVRLRVEQRDFVLRRLRLGVGAALDDLLLGLEHLRLGLFERMLLIGRIELEDHVAFVDAAARLGHAQDAKRRRRRPAR